MAHIIFENQEDNIFEAILYNTCNYLDIHNYSIPRQKRSQKVKVAIKQGIYNIIFKECEIIIRYQNVGIPLAVEHTTKFHKELELTSPSNNLENLREFVTDSVTFYDEHVLEKSKVENKLNLYLWDSGFWDSIKKKSKRSIHTVCYSKNKHLDLLEEIKNFRSEETEKEYDEYGMPYKFNVLLEGYPGTGKTSLATAIASELDLNLAILSFDSAMTDKCFFQALNIIPENSILLLEDIDVLFKDRKENDTMKSALTFSGLLNALDGISSAHKQIVFMTTNYSCNLDSALKRPGRVDKCIHFGYSDKEQIEQMFNKFLGDRENCFDEFYKQIKRYNLTSAILQKYLFENRKEPDLLKNINDIKVVAKSQNYDGATENLYS
jgi:hypothetical protein